MKIVPCKVLDLINLKGIGVQTTKKQLRIYTNALIKAICESKLRCEVDFTKTSIAFWVFGDEDVKFSSQIYVNSYTRKENHAKFKEMIKYLKGE